MSLPRLSNPAQVAQWAAALGQALDRLIEDVREVRGVRSLTDDDTATNRDALILCDATSAAFTVTLYSAVGNKGRKIAVKKTDSSANAVSIAFAGSETGDGASTISLSSQWDGKTLQSDGENWHIIGSV